MQLCEELSVVKSAERAALYVRVSANINQLKNQIHELRQVAEQRDRNRCRELPASQHQRRQGTRCAAMLLLLAAIVTRSV